MSGARMMPSRIHRCWSILRGTSPQSSSVSMSTPTSVSFFDSAKNVNIADSNINVTVQSGMSRHTRQRKRCPLLVESFKGRRRTLNNMHQSYNQLGVRSRNIFVLYGLGGSGKSQLAFKFVEESQRNGRYEPTDDPSVGHLHLTMLLDSLTSSLSTQRQKKRSKWTSQLSPRPTLNHQ